MSDTDKDADESLLASIADKLICPQCSGKVSLAPDAILCAGCHAKYTVRDGVPLMARMGTTDTWADGKTGEEDSSAYQERYHDVSEATEYNSMYKEKLFSRMSTAREFGLLRRLLGSQPHSATILELPCGGGRLSSQITPFADLVVEADIAEGQVLYGKRNSKTKTPQVWMTASAFHIPFRDESFDGTVCIRLCHHLPTAEERARLMKELFRVSKRFVLMTFFDFHSLKNTMRRLRRPFDRKPPKMTMTIKEVAKIAAANGAKLVEHPALAPFTSGHRYALMVR